MHYVKTSEIEVGDRFAKTIYNKDGVLLFNSGVKVDEFMKKKLQALNLYGTYILDAAEPVPPITEGEQEFERFQWTQTYVVDEILKEVLDHKVPGKIQNLVDVIYTRFGENNEKMIFNQCLRGENDFISKHSLNVAILSNLIAKKMNMDQKEIKYLIQAALFHDIGRLLVPHDILHKEGALDPVEMDKIYQCILDGYEEIGLNYQYPAGVRRYIIQLSVDLSNRLPNHPKNVLKLLPGTKIIQVADIYDTLTAIRCYKSPISPFSAIKIMQSEPEKYDSRTVDALIDCIHILPAGAYVMLSNGEQGIVVRENHRRIERPVVLGLMSNKLYDLEQRAVYDEIQIVDTVFTPDNRQQVELNTSKFIKQD